MWVKLAVLIAVLLLGIAFYIRYEKERPSSVPEDDLRVNDVPFIENFPHDINEIQIEEGEDTSIVLSKEDHEWKVIEKDVAIDQQKIEDFFDVIRSQRSSRIFDVQSENIDLSEFGLEDPDRKIFLKTPDWVIEFAIGDETPDGSKVYVLFDNKIYTLFSSFADSVDLTEEKLIKKEEAKEFIDQED